MLKAVTRQAARVDAKVKAMNSSPETKHPISTAHFFDHFATKEDIAVMVTAQDFLDAHRELIPSVSAGELAHYERVRATFEGVREGLVRPGALSLDDRRVSASSKTSSKGKGKAVVGKGKGKAATFSSEDDSEHGGFGAEGLNGRSKGKGRVGAAFQEQTPSDDEGLYE